MLYSKMFNEIKAAKEFETEATQLFNNATDNDIIEASIYFIKGSELMQKVLTEKAVKEAKSCTTQPKKQSNLKIFAKKLLCLR